MDPDCDMTKFVDFMKTLGWISGSYYSVLTIALIVQFFRFDRTLKKVFSGM